MTSTAPRVVAIVQARMGSTRLLGKVLKDLGGETVLARVVSRLRQCQTFKEIAVATTDNRGDDKIVSEGKRLGAVVFRGDERDVLDRYFRAAQLAKAEVVVRITSDCPLIDPEVTDKTVRRFLEERPDYASNTLVRSYPRGLDTEVIGMRALEIAWREASQPYAREHVTPYLYENGQRFTLLSVQGDNDYSSLRWTLDTPEDYEFVSTVYSKFGNRGEFGWRDVLKLLDREPGLVALNQSVQQKELRTD